MASGIALRLWRSGYRVILSELPCPLCIRRSVAFANAVYEGHMAVEGIESILIHDIAEAETIWAEDKIPLLIDPDISQIKELNPSVIIDARIMKSYRDDSHLSDAPLVIGLGPGFVAGENAHCMNTLMRVIPGGRIAGANAADEALS